MKLLAMLRGINVGTANRVKMADLLAAFETHGIHGASTFIQSGNVFFDWSESRAHAEDAFDLAFATLGLKSVAILRSADQMARVGASTAFAGSNAPEKLQFVTFLKEPFEGELVASEATEILYRTPTEIYWVAMPREGKAPAGPKLPAKVLAQSTNRNWIVTCALAKLLNPS